MTIWLCSQYSKDVSCSWTGARKAVDTALRERSDFPGVEALATLKRQCLSPRCSDELASKSRVSSRRAGSAKTVGELTSKGLFFKRAGGYLGQRAWALPSASAPPAGALACLPASWGTLVHRLSMSTASGRFRRLRRATIAAAISASTATIAATVASAAASQKSFFVFLRWGRAGLTSLRPRFRCQPAPLLESGLSHHQFLFGVSRVSFSQLAMGPQSVMTGCARKCPRLQTGKT